jgi:hypothetical protein
MLALWYGDLLYYQYGFWIHVHAATGNECLILVKLGQDNKLRFKHTSQENLC